MKHQNMFSVAPAVLSAAMLVLIVGITRAEAACSKAAFCGGWHAVCLRTLPTGVTAAECNRRRAVCLTSGCYHFNVPRARCITNAADLAMTSACKAA